MNYRYPVLFDAMIFDEPKEPPQDYYHPVLFEPVVFNKNPYPIPTPSGMQPQQALSEAQTASQLHQKQKQETAEKDLAASEKMKATDLAKLLLKKVPSRLLGGALYVYNGKAYELTTREDMRRIITKHCRRFINMVGNSSLTKQIYDSIMDEPDIVIKEADIDNSVVVLDNGVLHLSNRRLLPHTHQIFTTAKIKASYIPSGERSCPRFRAFLQDVTGGDQTLQQRLWEVIGYALVPDVNGKCFFLLQGVPNSGKSLLGSFLAGCFDPDQVTSLDIEAYGRQFGPSNLLGKRLSLSMDLAAAPWDTKAMGTLKSLTGNDQLSADVKYQSYVKFRNTATLLFGTNHALTTTVRDEAFLQRLIVVPFKFSVPKERQQWDLLEQFQREQDSIVSTAIDAYFGLRERNYVFAGEYQLNEVVAQGLPAAASLDQAVADFFCSSCMLSPNAIIFADDLFQAFTAQYPEFTEFTAFSAKFYAFCETNYPERVEKKRQRKDGAKNPTSAFVGVKLLGEN